MRNVYSKLQGGGGRKEENAVRGNVKELEVGIQLRHERELSSAETREVHGYQGLCFPLELEAGI